MADTEYRIKKSTLDGIGNAIRRKDGTSAKIPVPDLEGRIDAIETGTDTSDATATAAEIFKGKTAYLKGGKKTGAFTIETELTAQDAKIAALEEAVKSKAGNGGGNSKSVIFLKAGDYVETSELVNSSGLTVLDLGFAGRGVIDVPDDGLIGVRTSASATGILDDGSEIAFRSTFAPPPMSFFVAEIPTGHSALILTI